MIPLMSKGDLEKSVLYESVKTLVECESSHIHLAQHKLYTLASIAFQYFLYLSTKKPGYYIIRVEDSSLLDKLTRKSKDKITRQLFQKIALPRKLKYGNSIFHLDFFHLASWKTTSELPKEKIQGALILKNASEAPFLLTDDESGIAQPENFWLTTLLEVAPKTITLAYEQNFNEFKLEEINFPFIKSKDEIAVAGVKIANSVNLKDIN